MRRTSELNLSLDSTVLVIDDDANVRDLLQHILTREGFNVVTATNGTEGIKKARSLKPDVITLDVMMGGIDGWSVLSQLKAEFKEGLHGLNGNVEQVVTKQSYSQNNLLRQRPHE